MADLQEIIDTDAELPDDYESVEDHISKVLDGSQLPELILHELKVLNRKHELRYTKGLVVDLAYWMEEINADPVDVKGIMRHFPRSPEMRDCLKYNRAPTPRDFIDVWDRHGPRTAKKHVPTDS